MSGKRVLLIAGEISGDMHAARLVRAVRARAPDTEFFGIGGDALAAAGMEIMYHVRDMAVMGLTEVLRKYLWFRQVLNDMRRAALLHRPDLAILVDYPGFNLRFARQAKAQHVKILYYVCPQVWAWHRSRIGLMARVVDRLIAIFPFEPEVFAGTGLHVDFVGHPLVGEAAATAREPAPELAWRGEPRVALLPGSRRHEVQRILPVMWAAARRIQERQPEAGFIIAAASEQIAGLLRNVLRESGPGPAHWAIETGRTRHVLRQARAALVASGTATVEAALQRCPMVIAYRMAALTYWLGRRLVKVPHIGMVNLIARRRLCPEFIQHEATPENLADAVLPLLDEGPQRTAMLAGLDEVVGALGPAGAEERAAEIVLEELGVSGSTFAPDA